MSAIDSLIRVSRGERSSKGQEHSNSAVTGLVTNARSQSAMNSQRGCSVSPGFHFRAARSSVASYLRAKVNREPDIRANGRQRIPIGGFRL